MKLLIAILVVVLCNVCWSDKVTNESQDFKGYLNKCMDRVRSSKSIFKDLFNVKDYFYVDNMHRVHFVANETDFVSGIDSIELISYTAREDGNSVQLNATWKLSPVVRGKFYMNPGETKWWSFPSFEAKAVSGLFFNTLVRKGGFDLWEPVQLLQLAQLETTISNCTGRFLKYCDLCAERLDKYNWKERQNPHYVVKDRIENRIYDKLSKSS